MCQKIKDQRSANHLCPFIYSRLEFPPNIGTGVIREMITHSISSAHLIGLNEVRFGMDNVDSVSGSGSDFPDVLLIRRRRHVLRHVLVSDGAVGMGDGVMAGGD